MAIRQDIDPVGAALARFPRAELALGLLLMALVAGGYWLKMQPAAEVVSRDAAMKAGLDALYTKNDPEGAVGFFRKVLELNPKHYGANFQLGKALDAAGRPAEARVQWEKMKPMAEEAKDEESLATVRLRLARLEATAVKSEVLSEEAIQGALMTRGLDALYKNNDPAAAAEQFRKLLARNPVHYGANFQLAKALDRMGKAAEARPLWEKVEKMAEGYKDQPNLAIIRERLKQKP